MMQKRTVRSLVIAAILLLLTAYFVVDHVLPYSGIKPMRRKAEDLHWMLPKGVKPENYGMIGRECWIRTPDGLKLRAMIIASGQDTTLATVVVLHGISARLETDLERAKLLAEAGYASLLLDLRAHGGSEGDYCTFGYYEKNDLRAVADTLSQLFPGRPMGIWGASLGGAVALQAMEVEPRYAFGIVESTFDEFKKVAMEYGADWMFGLRSEWLTDRVLHKSGLIANFNPDEVKPVVSASKITRPILFFHGDKDSRIPLWFGKRNFDACPALGKRWVQVHGAGHNNLWRMAGDTMRAEVLRFLKAQE